MPDLAGPPDAPQGADTGRPALSLRPFRAVHYSAAAVGDLAAVTCPPYDVIGDTGVDEWERAHIANVVRLVLPRGGASAAERYAHAADLLASWLDSGVLVRDDAAALYVYEQRVDGDSFLGLVGAVGLSDPADGVILPHEDVFAGPVADRLALMEATGANLEPILLVYDGDGTASDVVDRTAATPPWLDVATEDGTRHRLWRINDAHAQQAIADDLSARRALIADGHHRYASYRGLQRNRQAAGRGSGPWDAGLALLVDSLRHPPRLAGIHRVVGGVDLGAFLQSARNGFRVRPLDRTAAEAALRALPAGDAFAVVVSDGVTAYRLDRPDAAVTASVLGDGVPEALRRLDATVVHEVLLRGLLGVAPEDQRVRYIHDVTDAVDHARRHSGVAVLMRPPEVADVVAVASRGERMPRKSTSFGPKPRNGFLLRLLDT